MFSQPDPNEFDIRFVDLAEVCFDEESLMMLWDFIPMTDCPHCIEGWVPDPDSEPVTVQLGPMVVLGVMPKRCDVCGGDGVVWWHCPN
jgi:hypothetical protein